MARPSIRPWNQPGTNIPTGNPLSNAQKQRWSAGAMGTGAMGHSNLYNQMTSSLPGLGLQHGSARAANQPTGMGGSGGMGGQSQAQQMYSHGMRGNLSAFNQGGALAGYKPMHGTAFNTAAINAGEMDPVTFSSFGEGPYATQLAPGQTPPNLAGPQIQAGVVGGTMPDGTIVGGGKTNPLDPLARALKDTGAQFGRQLGQQNLAQYQDMESTLTPKAMAERYKLDQQTRLAKHSGRAREKDLIRDWKRAKKYKKLTLAQLLNME